MDDASLPTWPLLPLLLDHVPEGLACALGQEGVPLQEFDDDPEAGRFVLFDGRGNQPPDCLPGQWAIDVAAWAAAIETMPSDKSASDVAHDRGAPEEVIAVSTATTEGRRAAWLRVLPELRAAVEHAGGIWLRVPPYPFPYRSVLNYRIDYAAWQPDWHEPLEHMLSGLEAASSHFYSGRVAAAACAAAGGFVGRDLGTLGRDPRVFDSAQENMDNIGRGIESFRALGLRAMGYATLADCVARDLTSTLELQGLSHCAYTSPEGESLPWFAPAGHLLHLPTHPVSLDELLAPEATPRLEAAKRPRGRPTRSPDAKRQLDEWLRGAYRTGTPLLLRGSAGVIAKADPSATHEMLAAVASCDGLWATTLTQFARWWRERMSVALSVVATAGGFAVRAAHLPEGLRAGVEFARGKHAALLPLDDERMEFSPDALVYERRESPGGRPRFPSDGRQRPHFRVRNLEDASEHAASLPAESGEADWRRWARRAVARWWRRSA
jgi:hypothetical protein